LMERVAVPAGGGSSLLHLGRLRASSDRHYDRSARCIAGLGLAGAGNACEKVHDLAGKPATTFPDHALKSARPPPPGWGGRTGPDVLPRPRKHGLKLEPWARKLPLVRAAVERRQASCPLPIPPPLAGEGWGGGSAAPQGAEVSEQRLSAFRFLSFFRISFRSPD
jgi:hypothetical protein